MKTQENLSRSWWHHQAGNQQQKFKLRSPLPFFFTTWQTSRIPRIYLYMTYDISSAPWAIPWEYIQARFWSGGTLGSEYQGASIFNHKNTNCCINSIYKNVHKPSFKEITIDRSGLFLGGWICLRSGFFKVAPSSKLYKFIAMQLAAKLKARILGAKDEARKQWRRSREVDWPKVNIGIRSLFVLFCPFLASLSSFVPFCPFLASFVLFCPF